MSVRILPSDVVERVRGRLERLYGVEAVPGLIRRLLLLAGRAERVRPLRSPAWDQSTVFLVAPPDAVVEAGRPALASLQEVLDEHLAGLADSLYLLPFCTMGAGDHYPVVNHRELQPTLGDWPDLRRLTARYHTMTDLLMNHVSGGSPWFRDFVNGIAPARNYFHSLVSAPDLSGIQWPAAGSPLEPVSTRHGERLVWSSFGGGCYDLDYRCPDLLFECLDIALGQVENGAGLLRLRHVSYLWEQPGAASMSRSRSADLVGLVRDVLAMLTPWVKVAVGTNLPVADGARLRRHADLCLDAPLPGLLLHALQRGSVAHLRDWLGNRREGALNVTAAWDGVPLRPLEGLLPDSDLQALINLGQERGGELRELHGPGSRRRPHRLRLAYFDALGAADDLFTGNHLRRFLCSQAIMLSLRGVPMVYFDSLFGPAPADRTTGAGMAPARWPRRTLDRRLRESDSLSRRLYEPYRRLLALRRDCPALHPEAGQRMLDMGDAVFAMLRGDAELLVLANLSAVEQRLPLRRLGGLPGGGEAMEDLISGLSVQPAGNGDLRLQGYQVVWLRPV